MVMQMLDGLSRVGPVIHHKAKPRFPKAEFRRQYPGGPMDLRHHRIVSRPHIHEPGDMRLGDKQNMYRRLGVNVPKPQHRLRFKNDIGRKRLLDNPAKKALRHARIILH